MSRTEVRTVHAFGGGRTGHGERAGRCVTVTRGVHEGPQEALQGVRLPEPPEWEAGRPQAAAPQPHS